MPQARGRRDVPLVPRHRQRGRRDARPRQLAAPRHLRPARARRARLRRDAGDHEAVRLLQGLPARVPDRRRHGQDEDRGAGRRQQAPRPVPARPARRLPAALRALCRAPRPAHERPQRHPGARLADGAPHGPLRQAPAAALAAIFAPSAACSRPPSPPSFTRGGGTREVALFADTFNTYFEPDNLHAAVEVLTRLGYRVTLLRTATAPSARRARCCCGRTFLSAGLVEEARAEARRVVAAAAAFLARGVPIVGLEPSCLLTLRDEFLSMLPGAETERLAAQAYLFEEFLVREADAGRIAGPIGRRTGKVLLHGHCHQKAFGAMGAVGAALALVEGLEVETVESSCCGMAGAFGYGADTYEASMAMGELSLLPAVRKAAPDTVIAADGFSCRHQIADGTGRQPLHVARVLQPGPDPHSHGGAATGRSRGRHRKLPINWAGQAARRTPAAVNQLSQDERRWPDCGRCGARKVRLISRLVRPTMKRCVSRFSPLRDRHGGREHDVTNARRPGAHYCSMVGSNRPSISQAGCFCWASPRWATPGPSRCLSVSFPASARACCPEWWRLLVAAFGILAPGPELVLRKARGWNAGRSAASSSCSARCWCSLPPSRLGSSLPGLAVMVSAFGRQDTQTGGSIVIFGVVMTMVCGLPVQGPAQPADPVRPRRDHS